MDADALYGLPLDRFVPERAALARELRSGGDRQQASAVAALRKPSVAAWAVNQLVRTQRSAFDELLEAGDALRDVQAGVINGSAGARELRAAAESERVAVDRLAEAACGLLSSGGHELSAATIERVTDTLHAAALDDEAREQVAGGRLARELRHVGLGGGLGGSWAEAGRASAGTSPRAPSRAGGRSAVSSAGADAGRPSEREPHAQDEQNEQSAEARRAAEAAARERREREKARQQARATERDAARELQRAERALRSAEERRARASEALDQAEAAAKDAATGLQAARAAHRQAKQQLDSV